MSRWIVVAGLLAWSGPARGAPLEVVLRDPGDAPVVVARLRGQLADLDVAMTTERAPVEAALDAQLATAARLAAAHHARAVVWFVARGGGVAVAIATPGDHRLFVREIPPADASAVAEAAAVALRGALKAIGDGGTIGVETPPPPVLETVTEPPARRSPLGFELAIGWQVALDAGADAGAHGLAQRTSVTRGPWAASLAFSLGPALRRAASDGADAGLAIELSRSTATLGLERRFGGFALAAVAGAVVYHRTTVATSTELAATPAVTTARLVAGPELRYQWRPGDGIDAGIEAVAGLDLVPGAPEPVVSRDGMIESLGALRTVQPRLGLKVFVGLP